MPEDRSALGPVSPLGWRCLPLAQALQGAGVTTISRNFEGSAHEFFGMGAVVPDAKEAVSFAAGELKEAFAARGAGQPK